MTKAANLANLASNTNFGVLNINRGGTGLSTLSGSGILVYEGGDSLTLTTAKTNYGGTGLASFNIAGAMYAVTANTLTTGTLPVLSGGTGTTSLANNALVVGRGVDPVYTISPSAANTMLISDGTRWVTNTTSQIFSGINALGGTQLWSNVTASRAINTSYTNSTGKPIVVSVIVLANSSTTIASNVGDINIANTALTNAIRTTIQTIVPSGNTYMIFTPNISATSVSSWTELR
jgi:hypothetical protein